MIWTRARWSVAIISSLAFATTPSAAQTGNGRVTGTITDRTAGAPISNVAITVVGTTLGARSGADGKFTINDVPAGRSTTESRAHRLHAGRSARHSCPRPNGDRQHGDVHGDRHARPDGRYRLRHAASFRSHRRYRIGHAECRADAGAVARADAARCGARRHGHAGVVGARVARCRFACAAVRPSPATTSRCT